ncbi:MAG: DUF1638 domain-containing protein [Candidatus Adiutrix sp.]|jgi:hypothetical protein|nr:DUF1638 domain-containing protein [Candidatus Adiutrix sp.]
MPGRRAIIACSIMKLELEAVAADRPVDIYYLEQGLHSTPQVMPRRIQEKIDELADLNHEGIILGYGLCSNGILGVSGRAVPLAAPRCHDCIALFLGSTRRYNELFSRRPGTYYLTAGWIMEADDPLGAVEGKYARRLGLKKAKRAMDLELANYTHICYLDNGLGDTGQARARALENCRAFNKEYMEVKGDLRYFQAMVNPSGPDEGAGFITVGPGQALTEAMFYRLGEPGLF